MRGLTLDLRYVFRILNSSRGFAAVAILSLAIGIGANTAIFSIVRSLLLEPLPLDHPDELALIYRSTPAMRTMQVNSSGYRDPANGVSYNSNFSYGLFKSIQRAARPTADVFGFNFVRQVSVSVDGQPPVIAGGLLASGNYFSTLRLGIAAGRPFDESDDRPGAAHVVVLSHAFWVRAFGTDPAVVGKTVVVNGMPFQVVGVTAAGYTGLSAGGFFPPTDVTLPLSTQPIITPRWADEGVSLFTAANRFWVRMVARVKPNASRAFLEQAFNSILRQEIQDAGVLVEPNNVDQATVRLLPGRRGLDSLRRDTERPLYFLTGVVVLVLLIACVNLASLMLARGVARQSEFALRRALGGSRLRLIRQSLIESLVLAFAGGAAGLILASWTGPLIVSMVTAGLGPVAMPFVMDWKLLALSAIVAITAALLSGLLPAMKLTATPSGSFLRHRGAGGTPRLTIGRTLIAVQVAVSLPLVVGAGLFLRTVQNLGAVDLGFSPQGLVLFRLDPTLTDNDPERHTRIYRQVLDRLEALPGVRSATLIENPLVSGITSDTNVRIGEQQVHMYKNAVGPRFFETMGMPLIAGRSLGIQDHNGSQSVVVINETAARKYFSGPPIGQHIRYGSRDDEVVGVVADSKYYSLRQTQVEPTLYDSAAQRGGGPGALYVVVRVAAAAETLEPEIRSAVADVDRNLPITEFKTQTEQIDATMGRERAFARLLVLFGGFALLLASIGLHGVTSYSVARRTSEIGVRLAVGAQRGDILRLVLRQVVVLALAGVVVGAPLAILAAPVVGTMLYGVLPGDPLTILAAACLMFAVALVAGFLPARRASRIEVIQALRHD